MGLEISPIYRVEIQGPFSEHSSSVALKTSSSYVVFTQQLVKWTGTWNAEQSGFEKWLRLEAVTGPHLVAVGRKTR